MVGNVNIDLILGVPLDFWRKHLLKKLPLVSLSGGFKDFLFSSGR